MTITPEVAALWLATKNKNNKALSMATVNRYVQELQEGNWRLNGQTIIFGKSGNLLNGQHRLKACVVSGVSFETLVALDVADEDFPSIDDNPQRTFADVLHIKKEVCTSSLSCGTRFIWQYANGQIMSDGHGAKSKIGSKRLLGLTLDQHPGLRDSVRTYQMLKARPGGFLLPASLAVGLHYLFSLVDQVKADRFFAMLQSGFEISAGHPIGLLRARLIAGKSATANLTREAMYFYTVTAWNVFVRGKPLRRLAFTGGDRSPEIIGLPTTLLKELLPKGNEENNESTSVSTDRRALLSAAR